MSSFLYILLIAFVGLSTVRSQNPLPECTATNSSDTCTDCYNLRICFENEAGEFTDVVIKCAVDSPKLPYCDEATNKCVETKPSNCDTNINITCYGEGTLPNPHDCHSYLTCDKVGVEAFVEECPPSYIYSHKDETCVQNVPCYQFTEDNLCRGNETKIVLYPNDASIYARCPPNGYLPKVKKCPGQYKFVIAESKCDAVCQKDHEKIRFEDCCNKYHECFKLTSGDFDKQTRHCPKHFNDKTQACDNLDCGNLKDCKNFFEDYQ